MENVAALAFKGVSNNAEYMEELLDILKESESKATFFINSKDIEDNEVTVNKIADGEFSIANRALDDSDFTGKAVYDIYESINSGCVRYKRTSWSKSDTTCPRAKHLTT